MPFNLASPRRASDQGFPLAEAYKDFNHSLPEKITAAFSSNQTSPPRLPARISGFSRGGCSGTRRHVCGCNWDTGRSKNRILGRLGDAEFECLSCRDLNLSARFRMPPGSSLLLHHMSLPIGWRGQKRFVPTNQIMLPPTAQRPGHEVKKKDLRYRK
jgi:hypothetical protein